MKTKVLTLRIDPELLERIRRESAIKGQTLTVYALRAIMKQLEIDEKE